MQIEIEIREKVREKESLARVRIFLKPAWFRIWIVLHERRTSRSPPGNTTNDQHTHYQPLQSSGDAHTSL